MGRRIATSWSGDSLDLILLQLRRTRSQGPSAPPPKIQTLDIPSQPGDPGISPQPVEGATPSRSARIEGQLQPDIFVALRSNGGLEILGPSASPTRGFEEEQMRPRSARPLGHRSDQRVEALAAAT